MRTPAITNLLAKTDYRVASLFLACVVYAVFGSPTPSSFGRAEFVVGILLLAAVGLPRARDAVLGRDETGFTLWRFSGRVFLLYGMSVTILVALLSGNSALNILRDIVPFLFLFLPLFLGPLLAQKSNHFLGLLCAVVLIGLVFSLRSLMGKDPSDLLYLENMPTVLFSALFLIGAAMQRLMGGFNMKSVVGATVLLMLAILPLAAMTVVHQRASLGAVSLYVVILFLYFFIKNPVRASVEAIVLAIAGVFVGTTFFDIFSDLLDKTVAVGMNMRPQEMAAVWQIFAADPLTFLFGIGWGGHFHSPAVGGVSVNFTHNFFSSIFLKAGFVGVLLAGGYVLGLLQKLSQAVIRFPVLGMAIAAPILIDLTLYASFKSLDFGLMLLMISGSLVYFVNSRTES